METKHASICSVQIVMEVYGCRGHVHTVHTCSYAGAREELSACVLAFACLLPLTRMENLSKNLCVICAHACRRESESGPLMKLADGSSGAVVGRAPIFA